MYPPVFTSCVVHFPTMMRIGIPQSRQGESPDSNPDDPDAPLRFRRIVRAKPFSAMNNYARLMTGCSLPLITSEA